MLTGPPVVPCAPKWFGVRRSRRRAPEQEAGELPHDNVVCGVSLALLAGKVLGHADPGSPRAPAAAVGIEGRRGRSRD
jgi:hypothetical protein